jgi:hypothetical protein
MSRIREDEARLLGAPQEFEFWIVLGWELERSILEKA